MEAVCPKDDKLWRCLFETRLGVCVEVSRQTKRAECLKTGWIKGRSRQTRGRLVGDGVEDRRQQQRREADELAHGRQRQRRRWKGGWWGRTDWVRNKDRHGRGNGRFE
uniref:Uncharacterized protein n=1 Tax=Panagrellus redivivus TaxID=6233 RepID=A0A7E4ZWG2_PANRE